MILTDLEIRAINALRRTPYAATLLGVAKRAAAAARERYETTPSSEENRLLVAESSDVIKLLFTKEL